MDVDEKTSIFARYLAVAKSISPFPVEIFVNYLITLILFPNLALANSHGLSPTWSSIAFLTMYGVGDSVGKALGSKRKWYNTLSISYTLFLRLFFFYSIPLMTKQFTQ